jgi:hypothetical protein
MQLSTWPVKNDRGNEMKRPLILRALKAANE